MALVASWLVFAVHQTLVGQLLAVLSSLMLTSLILSEDMDVASNGQMQLWCMARCACDTVSMSVGLDPHPGRTCAVASWRVHISG